MKVSLIELGFLVEGLKHVLDEEPHEANSDERSQFLTPWIFGGNMPRSKSSTKTKRNPRYEAVVMLMARLMQEAGRLHVADLVGEDPFTAELIGGTVWTPRTDGTCQHCFFDIKVHDQYGGYCPTKRKRISGGKAKK